MHELAASRGGKCHSLAYRDRRTPLEWECAKGHRWRVRPSDIMRGSWCRKCVADSLRGTLKEMQELATSRGGACLSIRYVTTNTKLKWACAQGHEWENSPAHIKRGQWCPWCKRVASEENSE